MIAIFAGWSVEELDACFIVTDSCGQKWAYVYFEEDRPAIGSEAVSKDEVHHCGVYLRRHRKPKEDSSC